MATKKVIEFKQIGQNLNVVIGDNKISRKIADKEQRETVKTLIADYNKKNSAAKEKEIIKIMTLDKVATKVKKEVKAAIVTKNVKTKSKIERVKNKPASVKEMQEAKEAVKQEPEVKKATTGRRGEY